jgi:uncharacterized protein
MTAVFLDTVGLVAMWNRSDQWHADASTAFAHLVRRQARLVTTSYILLECGNEAARRPYRTDVVALRQMLAARGDLMEPTVQEVERAWLDYAGDGPGSVGIVDQVSFAVMRRLGITEAFSNDRHFAAAGFSTLF